jgi:hypothetical protein
MHTSTHIETLTKGLAAGNLGAKTKDESKARKVLLKAIVTLRTADFFGMMVCATLWYT